MPNTFAGASEKFDFFLLTSGLLLNPANFLLLLELELELELTNAWGCFALEDPSKDATNSSYTLAAASCDRAIVDTRNAGVEQQSCNNHCCAHDSLALCWWR